MSEDVVGAWSFETDRLRVGPWREAADRLDLDLARVVAEMVTVRTTVALPESLQGELSVESVKGWIDDRDADASMLLLAESSSEQPVGILVLGEVPLSEPGFDLRIGYLFAESARGRGLATELPRAWSIGHEHNREFARRPAASTRRTERRYVSSRSAASG